MPAPRTPADLAVKIRSPGFTPARRDVATLFDVLGDSDEKAADAATRALAQIGADAAAEATRRFATSVPPARARLCGLVGRVARGTREPRLTAWLVERLNDTESKTRRRAILALGKIAPERGGKERSDIEDALLKAWEWTLPRDAREALPDLRAIAAALGNSGSERAFRVLDGELPDDRELARIAAEGRLKLGRRSARRDAATLDSTLAAAEPTDVLLHVRAGLEEILMSELAVDLAPRRAGAGRVAVTLVGPLDRLWKARTFLHFGFPVEVKSGNHTRGGDRAEPDVVAAAAAALSSEAARKIFTTWTRGKARYRIEWADAGRRRGATIRMAQAVSRACPDLLNDSTAALWEAVVSERPGRAGRRGDAASGIVLELWPKALADPRFTYRRRTLPASSHPTIAAALARVAGAFGDDVVWDPFAGGGTELIERSMLGSYGHLYGSDADASALDAARVNVAAAGIERCSLALGDARTWQPPERVSLVLTNPPMGRRLVGRAELLPLLEATLKNVAQALRPGGRLVWMSPLARETRAAARALGFSSRLEQRVDMGGFFADLQAFDLPRRRR